MSEHQGRPESQRFPKSQILRGRTKVMKLFAEGKSVVVPPFRVMYRWTDAPEEEPVKILFSVSRRNFRRATRRNRLRRLMREAWRRHRTPLMKLAERKQKTLHMALIFSRREVPEYKSIERKIIQVIHRLSSTDEAFV